MAHIEKIERQRKEIEHELAKWKERRIIVNK